MKTTPGAELLQRIERREAVVAVVGLGYIGLPLAGAFVEAGYPVLGYDVDASKIDCLGRGEAYLPHLSELTKTLAEAKAFSPVADPTALGRADAIFLCVPTPLGSHREPELRFVLDSTRQAAKQLRPGQLLVLTSTTYPGTTREEVLPILSEGGLVCGEDFFLAYSPERENPGSGLRTASIPKLVGGVDAMSARIAESLLGRVVDELHPVSSVEVAESAKLLENIYRAVNIALVNELKMLLNRLDIDVWEVIEAAATKPFGFEAFYPGPGLGGHCIPIDPFYLTWKAKEAGLATRFIELAGEINSAMPEYVVSEVAAALNEVDKPLKGAKVFLCGIAYKSNVADIRETPAAPILESLQAKGALVAYHDPHILHFPRMRKHRIELSSQTLTPELLEDQDCVLVVTAHDAIDWALVAAHAPLVVDTRNVLRSFGRSDVRKA